MADLERDAEPQGGRPSLRLVKRIGDAPADDLAPVVPVRDSIRRQGGQPMAGLVREWLTELKVMGRSEQSIRCYQQRGGVGYVTLL